MEACAKKIIIDVATADSNYGETESSIFESVRNRFINVFSDCEIGPLNEILQSILQFRSSIIRDGIPQDLIFDATHVELGGIHTKTRSRI